jgi:hypothetical protein
MPIPNVVGKYQVATFNTLWYPDSVPDPFRDWAAITMQTPTTQDPEQDAIIGWYNGTPMVGFVNSASYVRLYFPDAGVSGPSKPALFIVVIEGQFMEDAPVEYRIDRGPVREPNSQQIRGTQTSISFLDGPSLPKVQLARNIIFKTRPHPHGVITAPSRRVR